MMRLDKRCCLRGQGARLTKPQYGSSLAALYLYWLLVQLCLWPRLHHWVGLCSQQKFITPCLQDVVLQCRLSH